MVEKRTQSDEEALGEPDRWSFLQDPAVRALLDHVAEELASEFVRLMKDSVTEANDERKEKKP